MSNAKSNLSNKSAEATTCLAYAAFVYGISFLLPVYQVGNAKEIAGWQALRHVVDLFFSSRVLAGERPLLALMLLANGAGCFSFVLGIATRWRGSTLAGLVATGSGLSCLFFPQARLDEFLIGYYVWLSAFALVAVIGVHQWRTSSVRAKA
jgi:hypothetical protein